MTKNEIEEFIISGWQLTSYLYWNNRAYCFESWKEGDKKFHLSLYSFKAEKYNEKSFASYFHKDKTYVDLIIHKDDDFPTLQSAKEAALTDKCFEGKTFLELNSKLEWLEDDGPIIYVD